MFIDKHSLNETRKAPLSARVERQFLRVLEHEINICKFAENLKKTVVSQPDFNVQEAFFSIAVAGENFIDVDSLVAFFDRNSVEISYDDIMTIFRQMNKSLAGRIGFKDFVGCIMPEDVALTKRGSTGASSNVDGSPGKMRRSQNRSESKEDKQQNLGGSSSRFQFSKAQKEQEKTGSIRKSPKLEVEIPEDPIEKRNTPLPQRDKSPLVTSNSNLKPSEILRKSSVPTETDKRGSHVSGVSRPSQIGQKERTPTMESAINEEPKRSQVPTPNERERTPSRVSQKKEALSEHKGEVTPSQQSQVEGRQEKTPSRISQRRERETENERDRNRTPQRTPNRTPIGTPIKAPSERAKTPILSNREPQEVDKESQLTPNSRIDRGAEPIQENPTTSQSQRIVQGNQDPSRRSNRPSHSNAAGDHEEPIVQREETKQGKTPSAISNRSRAETEKEGVSVSNREGRGPPTNRSEISRQPVQIPTPAKSAVGEVKENEKEEVQIAEEKSSQSQRGAPTPTMSNARVEEEENAGAQEKVSQRSKTLVRSTQDIQKIEKSSTPVRSVRESKPVTPAESKRSSRSKAGKVVEQEVQEENKEKGAQENISERSRTPTRSGAQNSKRESLKSGIEERESKRTSKRPSQINGTAVQESIGGNEERQNEGLREEREGEAKNERQREASHQEVVESKRSSSRKVYKVESRESPPNHKQFDSNFTFQNPNISMEEPERLNPRSQQSEDPSGAYTRHFTGSNRLRNSPPRNDLNFEKERLRVSGVFDSDNRSPPKRRFEQRENEFQSTLRPFNGASSRRDFDSGVGNVSSRREYHDLAGKPSMKASIAQLSEEGEKNFQEEVRVSLLRTLKAKEDYEKELDTFRMELASASDFNIKEMFQLVCEAGKPSINQENLFVFIGGLDVLIKKYELALIWENRFGDKEELRLTDLVKLFARGGSEEVEMINRIPVDCGVKNTSDFKLTTLAHLKAFFKTWVKNEILFDEHKQTLTSKINSMARIVGVSTERKRLLVRKAVTSLPNGFDAKFAETIV